MLRLVLYTRVNVTITAVVWLLLWRNRKCLNQKRNLI